MLNSLRILDDKIHELETWSRDMARYLPRCAAALVERHAALPPDSAEAKQIRATLADIAEGLDGQLQEVKRLQEIRRTVKDGKATVRQGKK